MNLIEAGTGCFKTYTVRKGVSIDFIHTSNTYKGVFVATPKWAEEREEMFIDNARGLALRLCGDDEVPILVLKKYQEEYPTVLKTRVCVTQLDRDSTTIAVVWFDDGDKDARESLDEVFDEIDWSLALEFDY